MAVLGKPHNQSCPDNRKFTAEDLPAQIVAEFDQAVNGLLPHFAVAVLGAIRAHSGHLVSRFRADIDPALLAHRILLPNPEDCADQLTNALSDEINAIIAADELVSGSVSAEECVIRARSLMIPESGIRALDNRFRGSSDVNAAVQALVRDGIGSGKQSHSKWATKLFAEPEQAARSDLEFAAILQSRRHHARTAPMLTLGVVIERVSEGRTGLPHGLYLCLQPYCDSVRLKGPCGFPFLPLSVNEAAAPTFVVSDGRLPRGLRHRDEASPCMPGGVRSDRSAWTCLCFKTRQRLGVSYIKEIKRRVSVCGAPSRSARSKHRPSPRDGRQPCWG